MKKSELASAIAWLETFDEHKARAEKAELEARRNGNEREVEQAREEIERYTQRIKGALTLLHAFGYQETATFYTDRDGLIRRRFNLEQ